MQPTYSVINAVQAAGADVTLVGRKLTITGAPLIMYPQLTGYTRRAAVAETLQISTVTYTFANNTTYSFRLKQTVANGIVKDNVITYTSDSNATDAEVAANISALVTAHGYQITPSGAASPVTLTALTGYPKFTIVGISNVVVATGTPGVEPVGTYAKVVAATDGQLNTSTVEPTAGLTYTQYQLTYYRDTTESFGILHREAIFQHNLYVNDGDADYAAFNTLFVEFMNNYNGGAVTANPESLALT